MHVGMLSASEPCSNFSCIIRQHSLRPPPTCHCRHESPLGKHPTCSRRFWLSRLPLLLPLLRFFMAQEYFNARSSCCACRSPCSSQVALLVLGFRPLRVVWLQTWGKEFFPVVWSPVHHSSPLREHHGHSASSVRGKVHQI
jgi:hypothetical protein